MKLVELKYFSWLVIGALGWHGAQSHAAQAIQDREALREAARAYLEQAVRERHGVQARVRVRQPDPRLRLKACDGPLEAYLSRGSRLTSHTTVGVHCRGTQGWSLYLQAEVAIRKPVVVTKRLVKRGESLDAASLTLETRDIATLRGGFFDKPEQVAGMLARRDLTPGTPITAPSVKAPYMVRRGEQVTLENSQGSIRVRMRGKALSNAIRGATVRVRNLTSKRIVEGVAVAPGLVRVH